MGPSDLRGCMQWAGYMMGILAGQIGIPTLKNRLGTTSWGLATMFSGMCCPEITVMMIISTTMKLDTKSRFH